MLYLQILTYYTAWTIQSNAHQLPSFVKANNAAFDYLETIAIENEEHNICFNNLAFNGTIENYII